MSYFQHHVFFCCNQRDNGRECCEDYNASEIRAYAKARVKRLGLNGKGKVRINGAACLDRCSEGPVLVVYPENIWYRYETEADVDEIIDTHLAGGKVVERLQLKLPAFLESE